MLDSLRPSPHKQGQPKNPFQRPQPPTQRPHAMSLQLRPANQSQVTTSVTEPKSALPQTQSVTAVADEQQPRPLIQQPQQYFPMTPNLRPTLQRSMTVGHAALSGAYEAAK